MVSLEFVGLGEYTTPIFMPILFTFLILSIPLGAAITLGQRRLSSSLTRPPVYPFGTNPATSESIEDPGSLSRSALFTLPVRCPHCGKSIELDRVHWDGPMVLVCPECLGDVRVKVSE